MPIRALGVGLVAIAAVVATLTVARQRNVARESEAQAGPERPPEAPRVDLDALRSAGF